LSGDVWYLKDVLSDPGHPDIPPFRTALATFLTDFVRRPSALDGVDVKDMMPALVELRHGLIEPAFGKFRSAFGMARRASEKANGSKQN
jgi:hypothetical protein